jgi:chromosome segregation ATPase
VIEQAMIFALGFLLCGLLALLILPAVWRRALRLSTRRLEMLMPLSMDEVFAQRDQLRAQAAVEQRRIEQKLEAMIRDRASQLSEIGRRAAIIARLESDIESLSASLDARDADLREAWAQLGGMHSDTLDLATRLREAQASEAALQRLAQQFQALRMEFDTLRIEKATLETQMASLQMQDHDLRKSMEALQLELEKKTQLALGLASMAAQQEARLHELEASERQERRIRIQAEAALAAAEHGIGTAPEESAPALVGMEGDGARMTRPATHHHPAIG